MRKTWKQQFKSAFLGTVLGLVIPSLALGETATLLPNAKQQYVDDSGNPVANGKVNYFIPGTGTKKTVWQDAGETTPQTNPVLLDAAGRPQPAGQTYGFGSYRQQVLDANGVPVWDAVTTSTGGNGGSSGTTYVGDGLLVGTIVPTASMAISSQYLLTYGQTVSRATYPELLAALTITVSAICQSGSPIIGGFTDVSRVRIGSPVEALCLPPGATVIGVSGTTITVSANATISTNTAAVVFPWGDGDRATTFNVPDLRGYVLPGRINMGGVAASTITGTYYGADPNGMGAIGGAQSQVLAQTNLPNLNFPVADPGHSHTYAAPVSTVQPNGTAGTSNAWGNGSTIGTTNNATTGIVVGSGGSGTAFSRIQPSTTIDYMIKAVPDSSSSIVGGVTSLGGMQGILGCGFGITCSGNVVSVSTDVIPKVLSPVKLATATTLPTNTYANGASGVGATLTATANGALSVDSVAVTVSDRILVQNEASQLKNGIYTVTAAGNGGAPYVLTRSTDFDTSAEMLANSNVLVTTGTVNTGGRFALQNTVTTVGTTAAVFIQIYQAGVTAISGMVGPLTCNTTMVCAVSSLGVNTTHDFSWTGSHYFGSGRPWCDPVAYGAVADNGVTDNSTPIQFCINTLLATYGAGDVLLPPGTGVYCVWSKLTIASGSATSGGVTIRGTGQQRSVISGCTSSTVSLNITVMQMNSPWARMENVFVLGYGLRSADSVTVANVPALVIDTLCTFCKTNNVLVNGGNTNIQNLSTNFTEENTETQYAYGLAMNYFNSGGYVSESHFDQVWPAGTPAYGTSLPAWSNGVACNLGDVKSTGGFYIQYTNVSPQTTGGVAPTLKPYGFTITDGTCTAVLVAPTNYYAIQADSGTNELQMTKIDMTGSFTGGLLLTGTAKSVTCTDCVVGQVIVNGVKASSGTDLVLQNLHASRCIITGCQAVALDTSWTGPALINNLRVGNSVGYGVYTASGTGLTVSNSNVQTAAVSALHVAAGASRFTFTGNNVGYASNLVGISTAASAGVNTCVMTSNILTGAGTAQSLGAGSCVALLNTNL